MIQKLIRISLVALFAISSISCQNTQEKIQNFIISYNQNTRLITNQIVTSAKAEVESENIIKLKFETSIEDNESNKSLYKDIFPGMIGDLLSEDKAATGLLDEGVSFDVVFLADNNRELCSMIVDHKKMLEIIKNKLSKKSLAGEVGKNTSNDQVKLALEMMNRNLPITDKNAGTTVVKIDISDNKELVYYVEISDKDGAVLKNPNAKSLMKEGMLRAPQTSKVLSSVSGLGVNALKYIYQSKKGTVFTEIILSQEDLRK